MTMIFNAKLYGVFDYDENDVAVPKKTLRVELEIIQDLKRREDLFLGRNRSGNYFISPNDTWVHVRENYGASISQHSTTSNDSLGSPSRRSSAAVTESSDKAQQGDIDDTITRTSQLIRLPRNSASLSSSRRASSGESFVTHDLEQDEASIHQGDSSTLPKRRS